MYQRGERTAKVFDGYEGYFVEFYVKDKLVEMNKLNETIYATGIASSLQGTQTKSGNFINDDLLANVCKQHVTKETYEIGRLAQDLAGGLVGSMPSGIDFNEGAMSVSYTHLTLPTILLV